MFRTITKIWIVLIRHVLKPLAKSVLIPLGLTAEVAATDAVICKKMFGSGVTTLAICNEEMNDITKSYLKNLFINKRS